MENIIWQPRSEKWITNMAGMSDLQVRLQKPDQDIFCVDVTLTS